MSHIAFVFPGQGSQKIGMLAELAQDHAIIKETFDQASDVLGYDMWDLIQQGEQDAINLTERTQPILLASKTLPVSPVSIPNVLYVFSCISLFVIVRPNLLYIIKL